MSGRIPQGFIDELLARADIVELIGERVQLIKAGREYKARCPFHDEKTPSFTVSPDKGFYHCFGCGAHGTALGFLIEHDRLAFPEAVEELAGRVGLEVPREHAGQTDVQRPLHELLAQAARLYGERLRATPEALAYLKRRGIDDETASRFALGYAPDAWDTVLRALGGQPGRDDALLQAGLITENDTGRRYDRFRGRLMFPIRDARGRVLGFGGRVLDSGEPKYLNSPETPLFHKGRELYGLYEARQALRTIPRLLVVEGYMDVVGLARHGIGYSVATLGTATTPQQVARLFRVTSEVVFCFDGDRAGRAAAWRALENALPEVREGRQIRFLFLPEGEDPDSLVAAEGANAFEMRLADAVALSDFLVNRLAEQVDTDSLDGRARLAELARPLVARLPAGVYRELLMERLAATVGLAAARLEQLLQGDVRPERPSGRNTGAARQRSSAGRPSLIRQALTLVLHYPRIVAEGPDPAFLATLDRRGAQLLRAVVEDARAHPNITSAMLLEHWRDDPDGRHLGRLLTQELFIDEAGAASEYRDVMTRLSALALGDRVDSLRALASERPLTTAEKHELRELLQSRAPRH